jgi:lipoprotein-releasing system permease protein
MTRLPFELFLGLRYLKPKRTFVSVITLISLAGVTLGVWVLIVVIAVMTGFDIELRDTLIGMQSHVTVAGGLIEDSEEMIQEAMKLPRVKAASPFVLGPVFVEYNNRAHMPYLKGIDPKREVTVSKLGQYIKEGSLDLTGEKVVIGREFAAQYGIYLGDKITVYSPRNIEKRGEEVFLPLDLTVTGIFESGRVDYDLTLIITSLETGQDMYDLGTAVHGIEIMTDDPIRGAREVADGLNQKLRWPVRAQTWIDLNRDFLTAIQVEKTVMFLILIFIVVVAAFGIANTLITVTVQKTREIGVLKAVGATAGKILRIFVFQGFVVGVFGVAAGVALGLVTIQNINPIYRFLSRLVGVDLFGKAVYGFSHLPAHLTMPDLLTIVVAALAICTLAGLVPALRAARLEPVEALRYE